jgi:hypothetical protein
MVQLSTTTPHNPSFSNLPYLAIETHLRRPRLSMTIHDCAVTVGRDIFLVSAYWDKTRDAPINRAILNSTGVRWRGEATVVGVSRFTPYLKRIRNVWDAECALLKRVCAHPPSCLLYALPSLILVFFSFTRFLQAFKARRADNKRPPKHIS